MARKYASAGLSHITFKEFLPKFRKWAKSEEWDLKEKNKRGSGVSFRFFNGKDLLPEIIFCLHIHCKYMNWYDIDKVESNTTFRFADHWDM